MLFASTVTYALLYDVSSYARVDILSHYMAEFVFPGLFVGSTAASKKILAENCDNKIFSSYFKCGKVCKHQLS